MKNAASRRRRKLPKPATGRLDRMHERALKFVDHVSHEFRTPLTVIKEYTSLLHDGLVGDVNAEQRRMLQIVEDRVDDLTTMVDDMLDSNKLESGLLAAWRKPCRIEDIVNCVWPSLERKAAVKGVTLEIVLPAGLPAVYCDEEQAGRIVTNLAVNAIKYCGDPGVVRISCHADQASGEVTIDIADNGPGIRPDSLGQVFNRFQPQAPSVRSSTKGFGLGLSIARELAELNLGELRVTSELGVGSTFSCALPVSDPVEVLRRHAEQLARRHPAGFPISLLTVRLPESTPLPLARDVDAFLNFVRRPDDLLFRANDLVWLLALPRSGKALDDDRDRMQEALRAANRNRPHRPLPPLAPSLEGVFDAVAERDLLLAAVRAANDPGHEKLT